MEDWDTTDNVATEGRSFGKGRGYTTCKSEESSGGGYNSDFGGGRGRGGRGRGRGRGRGDDRGDRGGYRGGGFGNDRNRDDGWKSNNRDDDNGGGWKSNNRDGDGWGSSNDNRYDDDQSRGGGYSDRSDSRRGERGGRGGGGGGRGGRGGGRGFDDGGFDDGENRDSGGWNENKDGGQDGDNGPEGKKEPVTYVPEDLTEDELFAQLGIESGINFDNYEKIDVKVTGKNAPQPISSFADAGFRDLIMMNLRKCKYERPTPIQKYAIPIVMGGHDLMATAQTGSGKTAAFLLPIINSILSGECEAPRGKCCSPQALILSPTRELAIQIKDNAKLYTAQSSLKVEILYGGVAVRHQGTRISMGCNILIATPGRLNDFVNRGWVKFDAIQFLVLDEADRMLDMGFSQDLKSIVEHESMTPIDERQTLMFSATFSRDIQQMAGNYLRKNYIFVTVGVVGGACTDVEQKFMSLDKREKKSALVDILKEGNCDGTLVFINTQKNVDFLATYLSEKAIKTTSIHGGRFQHQREAALADFKSRRMSVLTATSVAARGLDIGGVKHVINYDLPGEIDEYVHRIGRTGRLGNRGKATSFFDSSQDSKLADDLVRILKQANQEVPDFLQTYGGGGGDYGNSSFGGTDYRKGNDGGATEGAEEECWD